jgi:WD40 repeat protein
MKRAFASFIVTTCVLALTDSALAAAPATAIAPENAGQVVELKRTGGPTVNSAAISPDGRLVAVATSLAVELRDANKLDAVVRMLECGMALQSVAFSSDGRLVAGGGKLGAICIWRVTDGRLVQKLSAPEGSGAIFKLMFSKDNKRLVAQSGEYNIYILIWDIATGLLLDRMYNSSFPNGVSFDQNIQKISLLQRGDTDKVYILNFKKDLLYTFSAKDIVNAALSSKGYYLVYSEANLYLDHNNFTNFTYTLRLYSLVNNQKVLDLVFDDYPFAFSFSADDRFLAVATIKSVKILNVENKLELVSELRWDHQVKSSNGLLTFNQNNSLMLFDRSYASIWIWRIPEGRLVGKWAQLEFQHALSKAAFSQDGELLLINRGSELELYLIGVFDNLRVTFYKKGNRFLRQLIDRVYPLTDDPVAISLNKNLFASSRGNGDFSSLVLISDFLGRDSSELEIRDRLFSLAFSPDEQLLAAGGNKVYLVDTRNRKVVRTLEHAQDLVTSLAFSSDGRLLVAASLDGVVRLWQMADGKLARELPKQKRAILAVAFSPDGALLATTGADKVVRLWRVADGKLAQTLKGHESIVGTVAFSADGALLASGALDGAINLWQVSDGKLLKTLKGHTDNVLGVAFMKDGRLAYASSDGTTRLWGVK